MLIIEANYAKKIGLPGYSSHQFSVTLRTDLTDLSHGKTATDARKPPYRSSSVGRALRRSGGLTGNTSFPRST